MLRYLLCLFSTFILVPQLFAQGENNVWTFGWHNGLDFSNNPPTFFQSSNESLEGSASVSDAAGNLVFYSDGNHVWDASGAMMPNGNGILGNGPGIGNLAPGSCAQGVAIVKSLSNSNQYYLFVLDAAEQIMGPTYPGYLRYTLVDMSLNGGMGDVVAAQKNMILDSFTSEKMTVTKGAGCYYWLIVHRSNSSMYRAFKIDATGINAPVSSNGTWGGDIGAGQLKVSPDGTKIAHCNSFFNSGIEIGLFDNATGMVSNTNIIDSGMSRLGTCFSPDGSKLYITSFGDLAQYDLSAFPNFGAIAASKVVIYSGLQFTQLRNGPDGKIYVAFYQNHPYIGTINSPNNTGMACNLNPTALPQSSWSQFTNIPGNPYGHGLGNDVVVGLNSDTTINGSLDTLLCADEGINVSAPGGYNDYLWNDGNTNPSRNITTDGIYWVYSYDECSIKVDSFNIQFTDIDVDLGEDTAICSNRQLLLDAGNVNDAHYVWQDGTTTSGYTVTQKGTYMVTVSKGNCTASDTIRVDVFDPYANIIEDDALICDDESITLHVEANPVSTYLWNNGSTEPVITVNEAGTYSVTATNACGTFHDEVTIEVQNCRCLPFIPNAFSPNGNQLNDEYKIRPNCEVTEFAMSIYNRYGQRIFHTNSPDKGWDGTFNGTLVDLGTYFYYIKFKGPRGDLFEKKGDIVLLR